MPFSTARFQLWLHCGGSVHFVWPSLNEQLILAICIPMFQDVSDVSDCENGEKVPYSHIHNHCGNLLGVTGADLGIL